MSGGGVVVAGLREFQRDLRAADAALPRELKRGFDHIGREVLVPEIQRRIRQQTHMHGRGPKRLADAVRATSQQREGRVTEGYAATPYVGWWEFGGWTRSPRGNTRRAIVRGGRAIFPALEAKRGEVARMIAQLMDAMRAKLNEANR